MASKKQSGDTASIFLLAAELQSSMEAAVALSQPTVVEKVESKPFISPNAKKRFKQKVFGTRPTKHKLPLVSIVIPVFNKASVTLGCLEQLSRQVSQYEFEVVVVDNASTDQTQELVGAIPGIKYIRNQTNEGFVGGCNKGVKHAKGKVIVLLNNDTSVLGNWLDGLVNRLLSDPSIGLVGSKLIYPNGQLQEAGGIIFNDGTGFNFGKNKKPDDFEFNYCRDVDYCSAASVAFYRDDFNKLDGFDKRYTPAYFEDADLAMNMHYKLHKRVVYEPRSVLVHIEGVTAGTNIDTGFKKYQEINHKKFFEKWRKELAKYHYPPSNEPFAAARYGKCPKVLIVDSIVPEYNKDAGSLRMNQVIKAAVKLGYDVTLYADNRVATQPYTAELQAIGVEVVYGGGLTLQDFYKQRADMYDSVILSRPTIAIWHLFYAQAYLPKARLLYDTVDLHYVRIHRQALVENHPKLFKEADKWQRLEYYLLDHADAAILVSDDEGQLLKKAKPKLKAYVVSTINPRPKSLKAGGFNQRSGLLFMGDYSRAPNYSAARWFVKSILPIIHKELPDVTVTLLGNKPAAIQNLAGEKVIVTGFVEDKDPYYNQARVFICPLLYGAGVKGKVSESIAFGLPVVSTAIGTEGMHLDNDITCLEAETPEAFAKQVIRIYTDSKLWNKINKNSLTVYEKYFSEEAALKAVQKTLNG